MVILRRRAAECGRFRLGDASLDLAVDPRRGPRRRVPTRAPMHASYVVRFLSRAAMTAGQAGSRRRCEKGIRRARCGRRARAASATLGATSLGALWAALLGIRGGRSVSSGPSHLDYDLLTPLCATGVARFVPLRARLADQRGGCEPRSSSRSRTSKITRRVSSIIRSTDSRWSALSVASMLRSCSSARSAARGLFIAC